MTSRTPSPSHPQPPPPGLAASWYQFQAQLSPQTHQPLDRISYFDTQTHLYLIATNRSMKQYRMMKFSKDDEKLDVHVFHSVHDRAYVSNLVQTLKAVTNADVNRGKARGILGFVRFTKGYYVILIKKRVEVARIGMHRIFEIKDTLMLSLNEQQSQTIFRRRTDEDEYREHFMNFELKNYFYYSHTYDLTNTLQTNMVTGWQQPGVSPAPLHHSQQQQQQRSVSASMRAGDDGGGDGAINGSAADQASVHSSSAAPAASACSRPPSICYSSVPIRSKFVWNEFLLGPVSLSGPRLAPDFESHFWNAPASSTRSSLGTSNSGSQSAEHSCSMMHKDGGIFVSDAWFPWVVFAIRGCVAQCTIEATGGNPLNIIVIGRTSRHFAGARYLRRGINEDGHVANHVEVEQIVYLPSSLNDVSTRGRFSSYVQVRGSVPVTWFHGMVNRPKPPILLGRTDPFFNSTRLHLEEIIKDFGTPVVLMNLLKMNEKKKREALLTNEYVKAFHVLTQDMPLPRDEQPLRYHAFDLRNAAERAWNSMTAIAERDGDDIGVFACDEVSVRLQSGVVRSNCVDCIDRTNLAQFFFGFHAFGKQLTALGVLHHEMDLAQSHEAAYDVLLRLYLCLGDAIAIQYGGSAQVGAGFLHRGIGWDKFMGIRRLYNNLLSDKNKQLVTNIFLGLYEPCPNPLRLGDQKLTLPLHKSAAAIADTVAAAQRRAAVAAEETQRERGMSMEDSDLQSPMMDDAAKLAIRRVVDIAEVEGDYYLHCSHGPQVASGEDLRDWWKQALEAYQQRYAHMTTTANAREEVPRVSRYSSVRQSRRPQALARRPSRSSSLPVLQHDSTESTEFASRLPSVDVTGAVASDALLLSDGPAPKTPSVAQTSGCALPVGGVGFSGSSRCASPSVGNVARERCEPYGILTSTGVVEVLADPNEWRGYATEVWLEDRRGATGIHIGDSDGEVEPSIIADMSPPPTIRSTSSATSICSASVLMSSTNRRCVARPDYGNNSQHECNRGFPWQRIAPAQLFPRRFASLVTRDAEPDVYYSRGPDYGRSCELIHNHQTYPDEVHNSIHMTELREYRRRCDEPPRRRDVDTIKIHCLLRFGPPQEWDEDTVIDAIDLVEEHGISKDMRQFIKLQRLTGHLLLHPSMIHHVVTHAHPEHRLLLTNFIELVKRIPVTADDAMERYASCVAEGWECTPDDIRDLIAPRCDELFPLDAATSYALWSAFSGPTSQHQQQGGGVGMGSQPSKSSSPWTMWQDSATAASPSPILTTGGGRQSPDTAAAANSGNSTECSSSVAEWLTKTQVVPVGVAFAEQTTRFLQRFVCDQLHPHTTEQFIRHLIRAMAAPPEDLNNRKKLGGGVPRFDRLRHHDLGHRGGPFDVVVLHHTFWGNTAIRWLIANSEALGLNLHLRESGEGDSFHYAAEFFGWMLDAGIVAVADTHDRASVGVDVWSPPLKDSAGGGFLERCVLRLFTMPALHPLTVLNLNEDRPVAAGSAVSESATKSNTLAGSSSRSIAIGSAPLVTQSFAHEPPPIPSASTSACARPLLPPPVVEAVRGFTAPPPSAPHFTLETHSATGTTVLEKSNGPVFALQLAERLVDMGFQALSMLSDPVASSFLIAEAAFDLSRQLTTIDVLSLSSDERLCFFVNIYNALYTHAWITALQNPAIEFRRFMCTYAYDIGGYLLTLHDVKHGVLRRNRPGPHDVLSPFDVLNANDHRIAFIPAYSERITSVPSVLAVAGEAAGFKVDGRLRVLVALMDVYLTPEHLADLTPYRPMVHRDEIMLSNTSMVRPIVYEDGFEMVEKDDSSDEEEDAGGAGGTPQGSGGAGGGANHNSSSLTTTNSNDKNSSMVAGSVTSTAKAYTTTGVGSGAATSKVTQASSQAPAGGSAFFANLFRGNKSRILPNKVVHPCLALTPSMMPQQLAAIETSFFAVLLDAQQPQTSVNGGQPYPKIIQALIGLEETGNTAEETLRSLGGGGGGRGGGGGGSGSALHMAPPTLFGGGAKKRRVHNIASVASPGLPRNN